MKIKPYKVKLNQLTIKKEIKSAAEGILSSKKFDKELDVQAKALQAYFNENEVNGFNPMLLICGIENKKDVGYAIDLAEASRGEKNFAIAKNKIIFTIGKKMATEKKDFLPTMCFMAAEAWMASVQKGTQEEKEFLNNPNMAVHDLKNKEEIMAICGTTIDKRFNQAIFKVTRTPNKKIILGLNPYFIYAGRKQKGSALSKDTTLNNNILELFFVGYASAYFDDKPKEDTSSKVEEKDN